MSKNQINSIQKQAPERTDTDIIQSASVTALFRALLADEQGLRKNPDHLAKYFVSDNWREFLTKPKTSSKILEKRLPGSTYYLLVRTKYFDDSLKKWLADNPESQVVFLGTGFDTRTIRFAKEMAKAKVFEVDLKAMLEYKKDVIKKNLLEKNPIDKTYVPINFHIDNTLNKLRDSGFDASIPTYFLMEGVTFFLEKFVIEELLSDIMHEVSASVSIAFDYAFENYINGDLSYHGATEIYGELAQIGEPHLFGINYDDFEHFATKNGYTVKDNYTALMLESWYLTSKKGDSIGRPHSFYSLATITNLKSVFPH